MLCQQGIRQPLLDQRGNRMQYRARMKIFGTVLAVVTAVTLAAPAWAQGSSSSSSASQSRNSNSDSNSRQDSHTHNDQDEARRALRQGKVMPLTAILEIAFRREKGTVLELELETQKGVLTYEIELLTDSGRKVQMWINARTGEILKVHYP